MKSVILVSVISILIGIPSLSQTPSNDQNWNVVFIDNFNSLNTSRWIVEHNFDHYGEPQMYTNRTDNVYISGGKLVLKVIEEDYMSHDYTSGWIHTSDQFQYGYFEITCKLPAGKGFWPAFWLHSGSCNGGNYNEIDIFEMDGKFTTKTTNNYHAYCTYSGYEEQTCPNYSTSYHSYSAEWSPNSIVWYLDDKFLRVEKNSMGMVHAQNLIANLAIFPWELPDSSTPFPSYMYIDQIKVYQLNMDCNTVVNDISNFTTFNYAVKKSISLGNGTTVPTSSTITLRATDYIVLNSNFEVPSGTEFILYPTSCY